MSLEMIEVEIVPVTLLSSFNDGVVTALVRVLDKDAEPITMPGHLTLSILPLSLSFHFI